VPAGALMREATRHALAEPGILGVNEAEGELAAAVDGDPSTPVSQPD
jgi:hypothetical protein